MVENSPAISDGSGALAPLAEALGRLRLDEAHREVFPVAGASKSVAATVTPSQEVSVKDLGRPGLFHGTEDAWAECNFVMRTIL